MHARQDISTDLRLLIRAQHGVVTFEQAAAHGLGVDAVSRLIDQGHWVRIARGRYDASPLTEGFEKRAWAALLTGGDRAAIGGEAALALHGLERRVGRIEVWVPPESQPDCIPGAVIRRDFLGRTERARGDLTRIAIEDAIVDVGQRLPTERLVALLADATRMRLVTQRRVAEAIDSRRRVRARKLFQEILGDLGGIESTLEYIYRRDVERAHGLPEGRRNKSVSIGTRTDVDYHEYGVLVELDGRLGHEDAGSAFRDLGRDNRHVVLGRVTLRYGSADLRAHACEVGLQVGVVLQDHGWPGPIRSCPHCVGVAAV